MVFDADTDCCCRCPHSFHSDTHTSRLANYIIWGYILLGVAATCLGYTIYGIVRTAKIIKKSK